MPHYGKPSVLMTCSGCGATIRKYQSQLRNRNQVFCTISCRNKNYKRLNPNWHPHNKKDWVEHVCVVCGKEFSCVPSRVGKCCSSRCSAINSNHSKTNHEVTWGDKISKTMKKRGVMRMNKNPAWRGGISRELYGLEFYDKAFKTEIRKAAGFTCALCGKNGYVIHHIDKDKKNNNPSNLLVLCPPDHARVHVHPEKYPQDFLKTLTKAPKESIPINDII